MTELAQNGPLQRVEKPPVALPRRTSLVVRFLEKVDITPGGCWQWTGYVEPETGYGWFRHPDTHRAHRAAYLLLVGSVATGMDIDHRCHSVDVSCPGGPCAHRSCVNPDHLEPTSERVNVLRGRGGDWSVCDRLHPGTATRIARQKRGRDVCRECRRVYEAERLARRRQERGRRSQPDG